MNPADFPGLHRAEDDPWRFSLAIPIWIPAVEGDIKVHGHQISVSQDTSDSVDLFDSNLNGAFALHFEAAKGRFGLFVDLMYIDLQIKGADNATDAEASVSGFIGEIGGFYTVLAPPPGKHGWGTFQIDALGGLRVSNLELGIDTNSFGGSASRTIYDPFIGARLTLGLTDWLSFKARGDVGGFAIDAWPTSEFSYNLDAGLQFHIADWFDIGVGYRRLSFDFASSTTKLDTSLSGPYVAIQFNF